MNRHESRTLAVRILYQLDLNKTLEFSSNDVYYALDPDIERTEEDLSFFHELVTGVIENISAIDEFISGLLTNYTIDRLSYVDRAIIRLATYELQFTKTPSQVIIDEAINLTKEYTDLDDGLSRRFNSSLLDKLGKGRNNGES